MCLANPQPHSLAHFNVLKDLLFFFFGSRVKSLLKCILLVLREFHTVRLIIVIYPSNFSRSTFLFPSHLIFGIFVFPIKTNLDYPNIVGCVAFHWNVVGLLGATPLKKTSFLLPALHSVGGDCLFVS